MSERATVEGEIRRSATTGLLDEGIDQYHSMSWTYSQRALRALLQESEYQGIANATVQLIPESAWSQIYSSHGAACSGGVGAEKARAQPIGCALEVCAGPNGLGVGVCRSAHFLL